jgi:hypothetical protein
MRYLILIITTFLLNACSEKKSETANNLIGNSDYCLIYKYDSLSNDFLLFNIPSVDTVDYLKKILTFDGKFKNAMAVSPNYRFDLIKKDSLNGVILIEQSTKPYLTIKSTGFEASRQLDYQLGMYLGDIQQNVHSEKSDSTLSFKSIGGLNIINCGFTKQPDSTFRMGILIWRNHQIENKKQDLARIVEQLDVYWNVANRDNEINLSEVSVHIGYPIEHGDVLKRHLNGFNKSKKWLEYVAKNYKNPDYKLTAELMLELDVYKPLNDFLKSKGFEMVEISLEKIGLVQPELLEEYGLDNKTIIPMPHMVWIKIGKTGGNSM